MEKAGGWLRYMSQPYAMPNQQDKGLLTDISTEELAHVEMISTMMFQLMQDATMDEIIAAGLGGYYTQHGRAVFLADANGVPFTSAYFQSMDDPVTNLHEDMAAEQRRTRRTSDELDG